MTPDDIKTLEAILEAQSDMELSESSDQYMRDLKQLINREKIKATRHRFIPTYNKIGMTLDFCAVCGMSEEARQAIDNYPRRIHVGFTHCLFNGQGDFIRRYERGGKIPDGCFIEYVDDNMLGHLINGKAQLQRHTIGGLVFRDGTKVIIETVAELNEE